MESEWIVPVIGDWVKDPRGFVWRIKGIHNEHGVLVEKLTPSGRMYSRYKKDISKLTKLDPAICKLMDKTLGSN